MKFRSPNANFSRRVCILSTVAWACLAASALFAAQESAAKVVPPATAPPSVGARAFDTPQQAADALVTAAEKFDVVTLIHILGPDGNDIIFSGEFPQDRKHAADFAAEARQKK